MFFLFLFSLLTLVFFCLAPHIVGVTFSFGGALGGNIITLLKMNGWNPENHRKKSRKIICHPPPWLGPSTSMTPWLGPSTSMTPWLGPSTSMTPWLGPSTSMTPWLGPSTSMAWSIHLHGFGPSTSMALVHPPPWLHGLVHPPPWLHGLVHPPPWLHGLVHPPPWLGLSTSMAWSIHLHGFGPSTSMTPWLGPSTSMTPWLGPSTSMTPWLGPSTSMTPWLGPSTSMAWSIHLHGLVHPPPWLWSIHLHDSMAWSIHLHDSMAWSIHLHGLVGSKTPHFPGEMGALTPQLEIPSFMVPQSNSIQRC